MRVELLLVAGLQPSRQRNLAARSASGEYLYFLDHDSEVEPGTIGRHLEALKKPKVVASGGPNLAGRPGGIMEELYGRVFSSPIGSPLVSSRYRGDGGVRPAGERDLILCNLLVRRDIFLEMGGFDPRLYPNEENEFLNRLADRGYGAIYRPDAPVRKPRKYSLAGFAWESFRNGNGRMHQIWVDIHPQDAIFLMVPLGLMAWAWSALDNPGLWWAIPGYFGVILAENMRILAQKPLVCGGLVAKTGCLAVISLLMILRHASYGIGLLWGGLWGWRARTVKISAMTLRLGRYLVERGRMAPAGGEKAEIGLL
jgi:glycosyltransferase involved in cell wall biosynthesis